MQQSYKLTELNRGGQSPQRPASNIQIDESLGRLSWLMDDMIRVPGLGWSFGLDAIVGLVPGLGDAATSLVSFYILASAVRYRVPKITLFRMGLNLAIDYLVGSLPFVGDLFDAWWKSNQRNVSLLNERATVSAGDARGGKLSDWIFVGLILLVLAALAIGSAALGVYLLVMLVERFAQGLAP